METLSNSNQTSTIISDTLAAKATNRRSAPAARKVVAKTAVVTKSVKQNTVPAKAVAATVGKSKTAIKNVAKDITTTGEKGLKEIKKNMEVSTMTKVFKTGKATSKIISSAGGKLINNSIKSTKAIAGIYSKASKKAWDLGKDFIAETSKVLSENQKVMKDTSVKAFKETVETIQESHIIEFPFKKK